MHAEAKAALEAAAKNAMLCIQATQALRLLFVGRVAKSFEAVHRKSQDHVYSRLHRHVETGELDGFGMVYLGQQDHRLPYCPPDLVTRDEVRNYPTDFAPISAKDLSLLTKRGEQLTHIIIDRYLPQL